MIFACGEGLHLTLRLRAADFGDGEHAVIAIGQCANAGNEQRDVGMALVVKPLLEVEGAAAGPVGRGSSRIVAQFGIVHREVERIDAEPVHTAIKPEARNVQQGILHCGQMHVELRLAAEEIVQIVLAAPGVPGPRRTAEHRLPIRRR